MSLPELSVSVSCLSAALQCRSPPAADRLNLFSLCVTSPSDVLSSGQRWHRIQESGGWHPELFGFQTSWPLHSIQPVTQVIPNCQVSQSGKEFSPWGRVLEDTVASLFVWLGVLNLLRSCCLCLSSSGIIYICACPSTSHLGNTIPNIHNGEISYQHL